MPQTVICFDFDGTLVDDDGNIHPSDVEVLKDHDSLILVPATGRPLRSVRYAFAHHGLFVGEKIPFPLVLENGGVVYESQEKLKDRFPFPQETQEILIEAALETPSVTFMLHSSDGVRNLWPDEIAHSMERRFHLNAMSFSGPDDLPDLIKYTAISDDRPLLEELYERTTDLKMERAFSLPNVLEFTPPGVDKGRGLAALLGDALEDLRLIAVGDGGNDLPLFAMADVSFAPSDSPDFIKDEAEHVLSRTENGVLTPIIERESL